MAVLATALVGPTAVAQSYDSAVPAAAGQDFVRSAPRAFIGDEPVVPRYYHVGTEVAFVAPVGVPKGSALPLSSIVRLGLEGRLSLGNDFDVTAALALPPKQSEVSNDPPLFGGLLMGRRAVGKRMSLYLAGAAERLQRLADPRDDGAWTTAAAGWDGRAFMDRRERWLAFSWNLGGDWGRTLGAGGDHPPWLVEVVTGVGVHMMAWDPRENEGVGLAMGADFAFPLANGGRAFWAPGAPELNPQTRADLYATLFASLATGWNIMVKLAFIDRGNSANPETLLPILSNGYDQRQVVVGLSYGGLRENKVLVPERVLQKGPTGTYPTQRSSP